MLVLTIREGGKVIIDGDVIMTIEKIHDGHVKVTFDAPIDVGIYRKELFDKMVRDGDITDTGNIAARKWRERESPELKDEKEAKILEYMQRAEKLLPLFGSVTDGKD